jgi:pilus assembly protein CpaB
VARIKVFLVLVLAVSVGGAFAYATYNYVQKAPTKSVSLPTRPVLVAASDLDIGATLRREDIRVIDWPANAVPSTAIGNPDEVIGRGVIMPVIQNELILPLKLASKEAGGGLPPVIPPGFRALSVRVNEVIGVAGYVLPGTRVDVVATVSPTDQHQDMTSKVILTNVLVLAAGTKIERDVEHNKPMPVTVVTLLVDPEQSERLTLAASEGKIQLALRNPLDKTTPTTRGIRPAALVGGDLALARPRAVRTASAKPTPPAAAPDLPTVEIIRGDKRAHEVVRQEQ